ncbi:dockerin type I domain-containing protein [Anaerotignum sp.]|nr:dockerin type I domain-containing protein [Anaerotignum sp.]MBQ7758664.1 carboxypeptidase regulatory-like domain-containing protein [Anaerotignum sp.]
MSMKRIFSLAMAATMLLSATAYGATVDGVTLADLEKEDGKFNVTYTGAADGKEYMIWAVKGTHTDANEVSFAQSNVLYINQNTATADGVTFDPFLPMKSEDSTVLVTGQGMEAPIIVGYIKAEGNTISGNIGLGGRTSGKLAGATVTLTSTTDETVTYTATTVADGSFVLENVMNGTYKMTVERASYLGYTKGTFTVNSNTTWTESIVLLPGDINGSGKVDALDFMQLKKSLLQSGVELPSDLNGSGKVDALDFMLLKQNLLKSSTVVE